MFVSQEKMIGQIFRHYKGKMYRLLAFARHSETQEELVVYQALYPPEDIWVRPKSMFFEDILLDGQKKSRFFPAEEV